MSLQDAEVVRPRTLDAALQVLETAAISGRPLRPLAGGTDLMVDAHFGKPLPAHGFLDLWPLRGELGGLLWNSAGDLEIGALATYAEVKGSQRVQAELPALVQACGLVGATQIQARGTLAGNVENGSPAADGVPALMAADARVRLQRKGSVREVALSEYYTGYRKTVRQADELITALVIPQSSLGEQGQWFRKVGTRSFQAITKVGLAAHLPREDGRLHRPRVVAVAMAAVIKRCPAIEAYLAGKDAIDPEGLRAAQARDLQPIDDIRSTDRYRAEVFARLLTEALARTAVSAQETVA